MVFTDEYEFEYDGTTYYVSVEGRQYYKETHIDNFEAVDEMGEALDSDTSAYQAAYDDALDREFEMEIHSRDFDYYGEVG